MGQYQCLDCSMKFNSNYDLRIHQYIHSGETPYECRHCDASFRTSDKRNKHEKNEHIGWQCDFCADKFDSKYQLTNHKKSMHPNQKANKGMNYFDFECEKCQLRFKTHEEADDHYIECEKEKNDENKLDEIMNSAENKKNKKLNDGNETVQVQKIDIAKKEKMEQDTFENKNNENEQLTAKRVITPYYCKECDKYFKSCWALGGHRGHKHSLKRKNGINQNDKNQNGMNVSNGSKSKKRKRIKPNKNKKNMDDAYIPRVKSIGTKRRKSKRLNSIKQKKEKRNLKRQRLIGGGNNTIEGEPAAKRRKKKPKFTITLKR